MRVASLLSLLGLVGLLGVVNACAPAAEESGSSEEAITLDDAAKFVVSATPERVVLRKEVDGERFPLAASELLGKALLVHPIRGKAEGGVFLWAHQVRDAGDELVVTGELLDFDDLVTLDADPRGEERIVRIYIDAALKPVEQAPNQAPTQAPGGVVTSSIDPFADLDFGVRTRNISGALTGNFPQVWAWSEITKNTSAFASVSNVKADGFRSNFNTEFGMAKGTGIDLGFTGSVDWKLQFDLNAVAGGRTALFETPQIVLLERMGFIPIAGIPVPSMLRVYAYSGCYAVGGLKYQGTITAGIHVSASASVHFTPSQGDPTTWIRPGNIPNKLEVEPFVDAVGPAPSAGIVCHVGRVNVDLEIGRICKGPKETCGAMVIAPYLGLVPQVFVSDGRLIAQEPGAKAYLSASLRFGAYGRMFGKGVSAEIDLLRWAPDKLPADAR